MADPLSTPIAWSGARCHWPICGRAPPRSAAMPAAFATRLPTARTAFSTVDQAAERIVQLLRNLRLRRRLGDRAKETVREKFLMSCLLENWLDLIDGCER